MNAAALLILILSNGGHWFGGELGRIKVTHAREADAERQIRWRLTRGATTLNRGRMPIEMQGAQFAMELPEVRVPTELSLEVELIDGQKVLDRVARPIYLYPRSPLRALHALGEDAIVILDRSTRLTPVLWAARVPHISCTHESEMKFLKPRVLLVGEDHFDGHPFEQARVIQLARAGVGVMILKQQVQQVAGIRLLSGRWSTVLWSSDPLVQTLRRREFLGENASGLRASPPMRMLASWSADGKSRGPGAVVETQIGTGRLLLCQLPLGEIKGDPLAQQFLRDVIVTLGSGVRRAGGIRELVDEK